MSSPEQVGSVLAGRYRIEQVLGRGGMGIVYRVLDERTQKAVALKRCVAKDRARLARYGALLEREYHTLAQLAHPHIIAVYDFGVDKHGPYYTMELLDSADLQRVDQLPWQQTCIVLRDVASALALLHSRGLLHCDVSLRNVHWAPNGRAKLIDFGAMVTMGVCKDAVGTPPFIAPEVLQMQALDDRVDIFALGALGYRLLTGRHAFAARRFSDLRDVWRSKPSFPTAIGSALPSELSAMILRMLTLDRSARPHRAGEVIERLRTIAQLEREDAAVISRAYLTTPTLVGREQALVAIRRHMLSLVRGDGGNVLVRGVAGSGRSRMLDAFALEGKLLGAVLVRADGRDARVGDWGVARTIGSQLIAHFPKQADEAARLSRNVLGHVLEELRGEEQFTNTNYAPERGLLVRELRDWILSLAKLQRLLIVVDDLERIDDASLALLVAIAHKAERHPVLLAVSALDDPQHPPATTLQRLRDIAHEIELEHLQPQQTEALFRSLFGDVANLPLCAARIHGLSHGNPRAAMELAQHLVDTGRARYEAGSWVLPHALDAHDLPSTLSASLLARLHDLSEDARELADALALTDEDALLMANYPALTRYGDGARIFRALDELVAARILSADAERYCFAQRGFVLVLLDAMSEERRRMLHVRVAALLANRGGDVLRRAHHLLAAGMDREAIDLLAGLDLASQIPPAYLLSSAIDRAERLTLPASTLHRLRMGLLVAAPYAMDYASFRRVAPVVLARLEQDSGLARYRELAHLPESERLTQAMVLTQQVYLAAPESERVHSVVEAIRELARVSTAIPNMAVTMFDLELVESLPTLEPLFGLSPSLPIVGQLVEGTKAWVRGRFLQARMIYLAILARITQADRAGLDDAQHERVRLAMHWILGLSAAAYGIPSAEEHAKLLEERREMRVSAWRVRALYELAIGNAAEATTCVRRADLLQAHEGLKERYVNSTTGIELLLRSRLGDLLGIKSQLQTLSWLATQYPGWRPVELLGRSRYCELQGDLLTALSLASAGLELARPGEHPFFSALAASQVSLSAQLGRVSEAVEQARHYLALGAQHALQSPDLPLRAALVLAQAGACDQAVQVLAPLLAESDEQGRVGLAAGSLYEARARIALAAGDAEAFDGSLKRCAAEYEKSKNPALLAQATALLDEAKQRGLVANEAADAIRQSLQPPAAESEYDTLHSRMAECVDRADRARCALTLLMQDSVSNLGYLYGCSAEHELTLLAALPDPPTGPDVAAWLERYVRAWVAARAARETSATASADLDTRAEDTSTASQSVSTTQSGAALGESRVSSTYVDADGKHLQAVLLVDSQTDRLAAVLVLEIIPRRPFGIAQQRVAAIARQLLEHDDVGT
jgi:hypothetical protein